MKRRIIALLLGVSMAVTACGQTGEPTTENGNQQVEETKEENSSQEGTQTQDETQKEDGQQEEAGQQDKTEEQAENQETAIEITYKTENSQTTASDGTVVGAYDYTYPIITIKGNEAASGEIAKDQETKKEAFATYLADVELSIVTPEGKEAFDNIQATVEEYWTISDSIIEEGSVVDSEAREKAHDRAFQELAPVYNEVYDALLDLMAVNVTKGDDTYSQIHNYPMHEAYQQSLYYL